jgi:hypothetical protein
VEVFDSGGGSYASKNKTSTGFRLNLSRNYSMVEVLEIVEVYRLF